MHSGGESQALAEGPSEQSSTYGQSRGAVQGGGVSLFLVLVIHFAAMLPEILVPLHIEFHQVTHLHWVDFTCPAVTDLKNTKAPLDQKFVHSFHKKINKCLLTYIRLHVFLISEASAIHVPVNERLL